VNSFAELSAYLLPNRSRNRIVDGWIGIALRWLEIEQYRDVRNAATVGIRPRVHHVTDESRIPEFGVFQGIKAGEDMH